MSRLTQPKHLSRCQSCAEYRAGFSVLTLALRAGWVLLASGLAAGCAAQGTTTATQATTSPTQALRPASEQRMLGPGVTFMRDVREEPRPLVLSVVEIALDQPGLEFLVTPGGDAGEREVNAQTTSQFVKREDLRLAINGSFFEPFRPGYPKAGDSVNVFGLCASRGAVYSEDEETHRSLNLDAQNRAAIIDDRALAWNAISGFELSLDLGNLSGDPAVHPRTAVGIDRDENMLILMVVDGRQKGYSEGVTLAELATLLLEYGAEEGMNLDGGGSSAMAWRDDDGNVVLLNRPINGLPGRERVVANHFGLRWEAAGAGE